VTGAVADVAAGTRAAVGLGSGRTVFSSNTDHSIRAFEEGPRRRLDLGEEPFAAEGCAEVRMEYLDGDVAIVLDIVREIHGRHAAGTEFTLDAISLGERCRESLCRVRH
jgi:hypothetical protein